MSIEWKLSGRLISLIEDLINESDFAANSSNYYPSIMWSLGGVMQGPDGVVTPIQPRYDVGLVEKNEAGRFKLRLPNKKFGYVIFDPKPQDANSSRRLIDFDGKDIVVR